MFNKNIGKNVKKNMRDESNLEVTIKGFQRISTCSYQLIKCKSPKDASNQQETVITGDTLVNKNLSGSAVYALVINTRQY